MLEISTTYTIDTLDTESKIKMHPRDNLSIGAYISPMKVNGSHLFIATPEQVWAGIRDPEKLRACIPQCEEITCVSDTFWQGKARVKIGFVKVSFTGDITLSDLNPPHSYRIHILAKGFVGQAEGHAFVRLVPESETTTRLVYESEVHLGIKILDKAMSLAENVAADLAEKFFTRLADVIKNGKTP